MYFSKAAFFLACLVQVIAHNPDQNQNQNSGLVGGNSQNSTQPRPKDRNNGTEINNAVVTVTVTATQQAKAALTVLTVTVTQTQQCALNPAGAVGTSTPSLVAPPVPNNASTTSLSISTAKKFITNGEIQLGLTSIPVAVASSLGQEGQGPPPPPSIPVIVTTTASTSTPVSPGIFVTSSISQVTPPPAGDATTTAFFTGTTFVTDASLTPGLSSIPVADSRKSAT